MARLLVLAVASLFTLPGAATAANVAVPLTLDHAFLRQLLLAQIYTDQGETAEAWNDGSGCNYMTLSAPKVDSDHERVRITSHLEARVGTLVAGTCLTALDWKGIVEVLEEPLLRGDSPVIEFRVVDSNIYDLQHKKRLASGTVWDLVKRYVHPRLATLQVDLRPALADVRDLLPLLLPSDDASRIDHVVQSLTLRSVAVADDGMVASIAFDVPKRTEAAPVAPQPEPTLTAEELARWEAASQQWDAFLTFVIKHAGGDTEKEEIRQQLVTVLLEERYDILDALAPSNPDQKDPVPDLFVQTWSRLAPVLRQLSGNLPGSQALRYLSFIAAADALEALKTTGPDLGLDISADGLRRMARLMAPDDSEDPLVYNLEVDPALRMLFGFGPPLPPPQPNPDVDLSRLWNWGAALAWAAEVPADLVSRLNRWAPDRSDLAVYLPMVRVLLHQTVDETLADKGLDSQFTDVYRWSVLATAWQETCWRQFIKDGSRIKPIRSAVGAVGLMQVNQKVWRGIYDVQGLQRDISYNARAGGEIVLHYMKDYAIAKGEHTKTGKLDNLARAMYGVYNGGPGHLRRYRSDKTKKSLRLIDESFRKKYEAVKAGNELNVAECYG